MWFTFSTRRRGRSAGGWGSSWNSRRKFPRRSCLGGGPSWSVCRSNARVLGRARDDGFFRWVAEANSLFSADDDGLSGSLRDTFMATRAIIRPSTEADLAAVAEVYAHYVRNTTST